MSKKWEIVQTRSGQSLGVYEADTAHLAIREMYADAGCGPDDIDRMEREQDYATLSCEDVGNV